MMTNHNELLSLRGVGPQTLRQLVRLEIFTIRDLLFHLPFRYQNRAEVQPIRLLSVEKEAVIEGTIVAIEKPLRGRTKLLCVLQDQTGKITLRFFHDLKFQGKALTVGARWRCYGHVRFMGHGLEMAHPEFRLIEKDKPLPLEPYLTPVYPTTEGLSQYQLRKLTTEALNRLTADPYFDELIPSEYLQSISNLSLKEALKFLHRPPLSASLSKLAEGQTQAHARLIFEELVAHRLGLLQLKSLFQAGKGTALPHEGRLTQAFLQALPFALTNAQQRVCAEVRADLAKAEPMLRLVQGDVGSGKTVIAAMAALQAIENHHQVALMAPTALLAEQHYRSFEKWLTPLGLSVVLLTSSVKGRARQTVLTALRQGEIQMIIGTHALFQSQVEFKNLGLVIVDEQHRFGVEQRALLRDKGVIADQHPHQLVMTATPIPRTLAMSVYANLDCSIVDELPPGRTPITTSIIAANKRDEVIARVRESCLAGRQAYWICSLIDKSEHLTYEAATELAKQLQQDCPDLAIGLIHGRMRAEEKEAVMQAFIAKEWTVLVATTVIEVGVDVPNASIIVIENAERLGLSQLHQLRGRVGRGTVASHCLLLYGAALSSHAKERLQVMRETTDGFKIAERDLTLRGPGEILGTQQTGEMTFWFADLMRDNEWLPSIVRVADSLLKTHNEQVAPLIKRWATRADGHQAV